MASEVPSAESLFESAQEEGTLSGSSVGALTAVPNIGASIQEALGVPADDVEASEVILLTVMPDDSGSIRQAGNEGIVILGHNEVVDALVASKQQDNILAHTRYLNGFVLNPFGPIDDVTRMDAGNYDAVHGTPLYDQSVVVLGTVLAKAQEFLDNGVAVRTITLLITDGEDVHSFQHTPADVKSIVDDMLASENHIVAAMGITDGHTDYTKVFEEMGIRPEWILTPKNTESDIRKAFAVFSQSAVRASQSSAAEFSQLGGFGASQTASA